MTQKFSLDDLVADLSPVAPISMRSGMGLLGAAMLVAVVGVIALFGLREALVSAQFPAENLLVLLLWFALALASGVTATQMAAPAIGSDRQSWRWVGWTAAAMPALGLVTLWRGGEAAWTQSAPTAALTCTLMSLLAGSSVALTLVLWLRRGAPVTPERAGLLVGIAAGASGSLAYALHCPVDGMVHTGLWHAAPVVIAALVGRMALPPLLRW